MWRKCDAIVTQNDANVTQMWRKCDAIVTQMWRNCDANVTQMWRKCDANDLKNKLSVLNDKQDIFYHLSSPQTQKTILQKAIMAEF